MKKLEDEKIMQTYPEQVDHVVQILNALGPEKSYFQMYFLHLYSEPNIRMNYQLQYLNDYLKDILIHNIHKNREDLIIKMIWNYWIDLIPEQYEKTSIEKFEKEESISFHSLEEQLNEILVYTLSEEEITYDYHSILKKMKAKEKNKKT